MATNHQESTGAERIVTAIPLRRRALLFVLLGLVQALCFPPVGLAVLLPLCIAAFLALLTDLPIKWAFRFGILYGFAWFAADLFWFTNIFAVGAIGLWAVMALFTGIFGALFVWLRKRLPQIPLWLLAALLWTGVEYYRSEPFIFNFGWLGLGYATLNGHLVSRFATWFGCYGVTFLIVCTAGAIAGSALNRNKTARLGAAAAYICFLVLYALPISVPPLVRSLRVRLVQAQSEDTEDLFQLSQPIAGSPVDIVVWPEYSFVSDVMHQPRTRAQVEDVARTNHAYLLFGAEDAFNPLDATAYHNTAFLLDHTGKLVGTHVKNHTVHFFRDGEPGTGAMPIHTPLGSLGIGICFDMDYPDVARRLTQGGAEVLLVPNDDPPDWGAVERIQHRAMFQMRALECGRWLARADVAGGTSVAMPNGVELARARTTGSEKLEVSISRLSAKTLFVRGGWRFGQFCFAVAIGLCIYSFAGSAAQRVRRAKR